MADRFEGALPFQEFLDATEANKTLWTEIYRRAEVPGDIVETALTLKNRWRFLVLAEDWCGDAINTLPYLARLVERVPSLEMRLLSRDENPDLMDAHLTGKSRSIPVVIILDEQHREVAWWGPRPTPLQDWFMAELKPLPKNERLRKTRAWYIRDRGRTTLQELLDRIPEGS